MQKRRNCRFLGTNWRQAEKWAAQQGWSMPELLVNFVDFAALYAITPISGYAVGAVSLGCFSLDYGQVTEFYVLFALKGFCFGAFAYLPRAMLADVVDLDTVRSGHARPASYFSILGFVTKCAASFGGLSLPILALVGFSAASGSVNGPDELRWLGILYAVVPTAVFVIALYLCVTWPLTADMHARVQRLVEKRLEKQARK